MRLVELSIKNFRGYRGEVRIPIDPNVTGITGRNDVGKSTLLEALDIFFEGGEVSFEGDDINVHDRDGTVEVTCVFDKLPVTLTIDAANPTTLAEEYLLNANGHLEIRKKYKRSGKPTVHLIAEHPAASKYEDLHTLKIADLRRRAEDLGVDRTNVTDERVSADWRKAIWQHAENLHRLNTELDLSKFSPETKTIQDKLLAHLPLFSLFRSDRPSRDNDPEAKDPMQAAVKQAQEELKDEIERLQEEVQKRVIARAGKTLEKLKEMDPDLASKLFPRFKAPPKWTFDFSLDGDDDIPINKRGSGVRRLVLLNFFRAEAERKITERNASSVIYAFEEPENSQHPSNQEMLVRALVEVGNQENRQVLLTTHVPALAGLLPTSGLRLVRRASSGQPIVEYGTDDVLTAISQTLGILLDPRASRAKGLLLLEGPGDVVFINHAVAQLRQANHIPATLEEKEIVPLWVGGCGLLKHWLALQIAERFNIPWAVLLDSDASAHGVETENIKQVNELLAQGHKAYVTRKRTIENYVLDEVVQPHCTGDATISITGYSDAKGDISRATNVSKGEVVDRFWLLMNAEQIRRTEAFSADGIQRYELTEILTAVLAMV